MATLGRIRSRFQAISRHLCLGGQNLYETCLLEVLLVNRTLRSRRFAGSHLDVKKHLRISSAQGAKYRDLPVIHINASFNNTVITLSDQKGKTLGWVSAGTEGFQNARRGSSTAGRQAGITAAYKAISHGIETARIKVRGIGTGRQGAINGIESGGVRVVSVTDVTPVPHNGCRPRKTRRL
ncbi:uncharacterized protein [Porites lutea]